MDLTPESVKSLIFGFFSKIEYSGIESVDQANDIACLVDDVYTTVKQSEVIGTIKASPLLVGVAESLDGTELFDCDDYALQLKASLTALYRTKRKTDDRIQPPAIGIIVSKSHALNVVICESTDNKPSLFLIDPSVKYPKLMSDPDSAATLLQTLPVVLIYM